MIELAVENAKAIGAGHSFIIFLKDAYPINVLNAVKNVPRGLPHLLRHRQPLPGDRCRDRAGPGHPGRDRRLLAQGRGGRSGKNLAEGTAEKDRVQTMTTKFPKQGDTAMKPMNRLILAGFILWAISGVSAQARPILAGRLEKAIEKAGKDETFPVSGVFYRQGPCSQRRHERRPAKTPFGNDPPGPQAPGQNGAGTDDL